MGDHKNMNEYYPPDFDHEKLPRLRTVGGQGRDKVLEIRTMLPWNIRCNICGHYMHRGTKFNARVEAATDYPKERGNYLFLKFSFLKFLKNNLFQIYMYLIFYFIFSTSSLHQYTTNLKDWLQFVIYKNTKILGYKLEFFPK